LHVDDVVDLYMMLLEVPDDAIAGQIFNAGYQNHTVAEIAEIVRQVVEREMPELGKIDIETTPSNDLRSYRISSEKIRQQLGFEPQHTIDDAVTELCHAFKQGLIPDAMSDIKYYNVKVMQAVALG